MPNLLDAAGAEPKTKAPSQTLLSTKQVKRLFGGDDGVATLLLELSLGAYRDECNVVRIGLVEPDVHEHDRWLFEFHPDLPDTAGDRQGWYTRGEKGKSTVCDDSLSLPLSARAMVSVLAFYTVMIKQVRSRLLQQSDTYVDATEVLAAATMINSMDVNDLVDVDYSASMIDLHLLVHHTSDFLALHPDHVGIQRGSLLSLYGLADPYRDFHRFSELAR